MKAKPDSANESPTTIHYTLLLVPSKGLEPPHPCEYMDLNHARLPIPPRWQVDFHCSGDPSSPCQEDQPFYSTDATPPVKPRPTAGLRLMCAQSNYKSIPDSFELPWSVHGLHR